MNRLAACCCALLITTAADSLLADNWPQFRGPGGLGASEERGLPGWSTTENIAWKTDLPGPGSSSPIVWGDRIFITCYSGYGLDESNPGNPDNLKRHLLCIQRMDGKINWDRTVNGAAAIPFDGFQALHGYASSTPATDGTLVYVFFEKEGVFAFDYSGQQVWARVSASRPIPGVRERARCSTRIWSSSMLLSKMVHWLRSTGKRARRHGGRVACRSRGAHPC